MEELRGRGDSSRAADRWRRRGRSSILTASGRLQGFSVRQAFAGKHVMLIGVTGFIGKVWLANTLLDLPGCETDLSADPAAEVESGGAALREDGGRIAGFRSAV